MSRISELFKQRAKILSIYCTAGFPKLNSTIEIMQSLQENGADMIELGMPYSDPLADGPTIQQSSSIALANGMTIKKLFDQIKDLREVIHVPVVLMGYMNPVLQFGFEKFCREAAAAGIDGLILPDLPVHEFESRYGVLIKKYGLDFIFLVTPETAPQRIKKLDNLSSGFLYAVSSSSTTGSKNNLSQMPDYLEKIKLMNLQNPVLVGFGINDKASFELACGYVNGAIIGSAYIRAIQNGNNVKAATKSFLSSILSG
jgi:tryptophan synthase alpha chain